MNLRDHPELQALAITDEEADLIVLSWAREHPKSGSIPIEEVRVHLERIRAAQAEVAKQVPDRATPTWLIGAVLALLVVSIVVTYVLLVRG